MINNKPWEVLTPTEILIAIRNHILQEPSRLEMDFWVLNGTPGERIRSYLEQTFPSCGTIGCIGGWGKLLTESPETDLRKVLKLTRSQAKRLFYVSSWPYQFAMDYNNAVYKQNHKWKAQITADYINWFIRLEFSVHETD